MRSAATLSASVAVLLPAPPHPPNRPAPADAGSCPDRATGRGNWSDLEKDAKQGVYNVFFCSVHIAHVNMDWKYLN